MWMRWLLNNGVQIPSLVHIVTLIVTEEVIVGQYAGHGIYRVNVPVILIIFADVKVFKPFNQEFENIIFRIPILSILVIYEEFIFSI
jgi:Mg2+/Co2+ transporter CorB